METRLIRCGPDLFDIMARWGRGRLQCVGHLAWGGAQRVLSTPRRLASLAVVPLAVVGAIALGQASGLLDPVLPPAMLPWLLWGFAGVFGLSLLGNMATSSRPERLHGVPLTVIIASCSLWLAIYGS